MPRATNNGGPREEGYPAKTSETDALTGDNSGMVETLAAALEEAWLARGYGEGDHWNYLAKTALKVTHHEELSAALKRLVTRVRLEIRNGTLRLNFANQCLDDADVVLTKIGGAS